MNDDLITNWRNNNFYYIINSVYYPIIFFLQGHIMKFSAFAFDEDEDTDRSNISKSEVEKDFKKK